MKTRQTFKAMLDQYGVHHAMLWMFHEYMTNEEYRIEIEQRYVDALCKDLDKAEDELV